jgi:UDP-N-acetylglucosamine--dolichyl-phosphate N-acetylglucosaminephosphotransferase
MGLPTAIIYLVDLFLFVPFPFMSYFNGDATLVHDENPTIGTFPYHKVIVDGLISMFESIRKQS